MEYFRKPPTRMISTLTLAAVLSLLFALPALAWQAEGGTKNCGALTGYVHGVYNDTAALTGPGGSTGYYTPNDGSWHTQERNGADGGGDWLALGDPLLNFSQTYAGCRST
jgi:hypothetical protein